MKKIFLILIIVLFVLNGLWAGAGSIFTIDDSIEGGRILSNSENDELDQYQKEFGGGSIAVGNDTANGKYVIAAQSFIPTKNTLTRVEIIAGKSPTAIDNYTLAIRDNLLGQDLTSLSLSPDNFVTEDYSWVEFDFDNIIVIPGSTYYIISSTPDSPDNWYTWGHYGVDPYPIGSEWLSEDYGSSWEEEINKDFTFATYGFNNFPPEIPVITGPISGKAGTPYNYTFNSVDPENDSVYYYIKWGDGHVEIWDGLYASGEDAIISHTYARQGNYTIIAKAKDIHDVESDWGTFEVTIPRNKIINNVLLLRLLERFPLVQKLLLRFGL